MEKSRLIKIGIITTTAVLVIAYIALSALKISKLKSEKAILQNNQEILLTENNAILKESRKYRVSDSLNAIKVSELRLTLEEYKKYRAEDLELIKKLKIDKSDMQKIIKAQNETIESISTQTKDTIVIRDSVPVGAKAFDYKSKWTDVSGLILKDSINLDIHNREALVIVESVKYKRFLGFLWKTKKVKSRNVDIVSLNPNTTIVDAQYERIENN